MTTTFHIDNEESNASGSLAIKVCRPYCREEILRLPGGPEKDIFERLYSHEIAYVRKKGNRFVGGMTPIAIFHVGYSGAMETLKSLAASGKLYFKNVLLICDFFSKNELYFLVNQESGKNINISGKIKSSNNEFDLTECEFICGGHPLIFIKNGFLKIIATEIGWKDFKQLHSSPSSVTLAQLKENYDDSDPDHPQFIFENNSEQNISLEKPMPTPLLVLKERTGAFADLWMVYENPTTKEKIKIAMHNPAPVIRDKRGNALVRRENECEKQWETDLLETDFIKKMVGTTHYYCPVDCVAKSLTFLLEIGWQIEDWEGRTVCRQTEDAQLEIQTEANVVLIKGKIGYGEHIAELQDVIGAFNRRERFVQLGDNLVGLLPQKIEVQGLQAAIDEGEITNRGISIKKNRLGCFSELLESQTPIAYDDGFKVLKEKLLSFSGIENSPPETSFKGILRPYQQDGVNWISFLYNYGFHGLLADDMGLGKTIQVLAFLSRLETQDPVLIVLPTSLIFNWKREIEKFLPEHSFVVYHGQQRVKSVEEIHKKMIILTSYTTLRIDFPLFQKQHYECVILDEAQTIKNSQTQTAKILYQLQSRFRLSLSGTPIENHPRELWAHFRFLMPDLFGDEQSFLSEAAAGQSDFRHIQRIRKKIKPFFLRRTKEEVANDLPEKIEQIVWVEMGAEQKKVYESLLSGFRTNLISQIESEGMAKHRMEVLEAILRLRQICCHPQLAIDTQAPSAKMEAALEDLEIAISEGRKILLYSQFTSMLSLFAKEVKNRGWKFAYLDGSTTNREKVVQQFQEDKSIQLFLISLKAGGIGLNLTAADYVFLYDPWWNDAVENQAIDRAHRIGRKETVIAKRYLVLESIEEKIMKLKELKRNLITDIIHEDLGNLSLSIEDLRFLLS